jgi:hypothetical protein
LLSFTWPLYSSLLAFNWSAAIVPPTFEAHAGLAAIGELHTCSLQGAPNRFQIGWPERQNSGLEIRNQCRWHDGGSGQIGLGKAMSARAARHWPGVTSAACL